MRRFKKITFSLFKLPKIKLEEVFTPATAAEVNYIGRKDIDAQLLSEMKTPGKQIIVFGHSGSGKTSSVRNLLNRNGYKYIRTQCESNTTFEQLILNAFDELNVYVVSGRTHKQSTSLKGDIAAEYKSIKASISSGLMSETGETYTRLLPPQLTPQKLAKFLGEGKIVWLIEDFHKVSLNEKVRIADAIKIFVDNANDYPISKIICIGACQSAHELIELDPNLQSRVSEISVPLLTDGEIEKIIRNGFSLLNIIPSQSLVEKLIFYSDRLGASAHQMCMDICKGKNIYKTKIKKHQIDDSSFQFAVNGFIERSSDTLKSIYESATKNELGWYILKTLTHNVKDKLSFEEICRRVNNGKATFNDDEIKAKLDELQSPAFDIIYYNPKSEKYAFSSPFWHRFLRLQFSIETADKVRKKKNKCNRNLELVSDDAKYQMVDTSMLELIKAWKTLQSLEIN